MNYAKIPFNFIMESTNDYLVQPTVNATLICVKGTNDYLVQPINETIVQPTGEFVNYRVIKPCKSILKIKENNNNEQSFQTVLLTSEATKYVRFCDVVQSSSTNSSIKSNNSVNVVNEISDEELSCIKYYHLKKNNQTYFQHLSQTLSYSGRSFKASFYFLIHAFIPDLFEYNGSTTLYSLTDTIKLKYESNLEEGVSTTYD